MNQSSFKSWIALSSCCLLLVCSIIYYFTYQKEPSIQTYSATLTDIGFDTSLSFEAECTSEEFDQYISIIEEKYKYYNQLFDQYNEYEGVNNVYTLNQNAYSHPVEVDEELIDCIQTALDINEISTQFDITQGCLLSLWHTYRLEGMELNNEGKNGNLPTEIEITEAKKHGGKENILIEDNTITYLDPNLSIDLGGIAKGYATQKVKEALIDAGCSHAFINAGGNVALIGLKSDGSDWNVGIHSPDSNSALLDYICSDSKCIVTSGDYQRYYTVDNTKYSHIIDIQTGYPANYVRSVTVIMDNSCLADALSTTLFCMSVEDGMKLVDQLKQSYDIEVVWIVDQQTSSLSPYLSNKNYDVYITNDLKESVVFA